MTNEQIPTFTGDETLEERLKNWDKEKKGLINDLQSEREKRHSLEERLAEIETSLDSAGADGGERPEDKVNQLAQDPDSYIERRFKAHVEPLVKELNDLRWERKFDKAYQWLGKQLKKDVEEIYGSEEEKDLVRIVKEHGMTNMDPIEGTKAAYKIYLQEKQEKEEREEERSNNIQTQSTETVRNIPRTGSSRFSAQQIATMSQEEYEKYRQEIRDAEKRGEIKT